MNILDAITNAQGGAAVRQLGQQFGLGEQQTNAALSALLPALAGGMQRNLQGQGGVGELMSALTTGTHQPYDGNSRAGTRTQDHQSYWA